MRLRPFFYWTLFFGLCSEAKTQSFEIPIYFEDSANHHDTIVVGYDISASYLIDPEFGEFDILDSAYSKPHEVRAAIYDYYWEWPSLPRIIESKKMIIGYVCYDPNYFDEANSIMVVIKSNNWPITLSWDNSLFQEACHRLDIVDCTPGGWFDVCGGGHPYLLLNMLMTDTATYYSSEYIIETNGDNLQALFLRFYNFESGIEIEKDNKSVKFPNPNQGSFRLDYSLSPDDVIQISDLYGRPISFTYENQHINISGAPDGIYFMTIILETGEGFCKKFLKVSE